MVEQAWIANFLLACLLMGLGIGMDVAIATFLRAGALAKKRVATTWVVGVSATHTIFPMVGYLLTYFSIQTLPVLTPIIGLIAFLLIGHFLLAELKESEDENHSSLISLGLILAVSWDALWSGPAKSAQVMDWPEWLIWFSFVLVGIVVTTFCLLSLFIARRLSQTKCLAATKSLGLGQWIQYSIIAYFGLLALLRYTFDVSIGWQFILLLSFAIMYVVLKRKRKPHQLMKRAVQEA